MELEVVVDDAGRRRLERRLVTVGPEEVRAGALSIMRAAIASVSYQPRARRRQSVVCSDRSGQPLIEVVLEHVVDAHALISALGRTPADCRQEWAVGGPFLATGSRTLLSLILATVAAVTTGALLSGTGLGLTAMIFAPLAAFVVTILLLFWPAHVVVGADGILWRWYGARRFIPWKEVVAQEGTDRIAGGYHDIVIQRRDGSAMRLPQAATASSIDQASLRARVDALFHAHAEHGNDAVIDRLVRSSRSLVSWRAALGRVRGNEGYREMGIPDETLWRIVEDASAPEDARVGAAVALRHAEDAAPRLRVAAGAVVSPQLRVALEAAADPALEESALDEALARITR